MQPVPPDRPLTDGVVALRPPDERDLEAIDAGIHDADVVRWIGAPEGSAPEVLGLNRRRWAAGSPTFAICEADDVCVGHVWLNRGSRDPGVGYVGYWLLPRGRGRGLATRAVRLLCAWATSELGLKEIRLLTELGNVASQRVAERSGFERGGIVIRNAESDGRPADHILYVAREAAEPSSNARDGR